MKLEDFEFNYNESWTSSYQFNWRHQSMPPRVQTPKEHHIQQEYKKYNQNIHDKHEWLGSQVVSDWIRKIYFVVRLSKIHLGRMHTFLFTLYNSLYYLAGLSSIKINRLGFCIYSSRIMIVRLGSGMTNIVHAKNQYLFCSELLKTIPI